MDDNRQNPYSTPAAPEQVPSPSDYPLKWHKFLICFSLWASAVLNVFNAVRLFSGSQYNGLAASVYAVYPGLRLLDQGYGVLLVALAVFAIKTRFDLAGWRKIGPAELKALYILSCATSLLYLALASGVLSIPFGGLLTSDVYGSLFGSIVMVIANAVYYNKRSALFTN